MFIGLQEKNKRGTKSFCLDQEYLIRIRLINLDLKGPFYSMIRASTLLHVSGIIGCLMQMHVIFLMMWRREGEERERGGCFAKQPPHRLKIRTIKLLTNYCMSCRRTTQNIPIFHSTTYGICYYYNKKMTTYCRGRPFNRLNMICYCMRSSIRRLQYTCS
jgi:hypothetical protein